MLTTLSNSLMLEILQFLPPKDLLNLSKTCAKFKDLLSDLKLKSLWIHADLSGLPLEREENRNLLEYIHEGTLSLSLDSLTFGQNDISETIIRSIGAKCPRLKVLRLEGSLSPHYVVNVEFFPRSLTVLVIKACSPRNGSWYTFPGFMDTHLYLPLLEKIEINWEIEDRIKFVCLRFFKDLPNLKELKIREARLEEGFPEDGFPSLTKLDLLDTYLKINNNRGTPANLRAGLKELSINLVNMGQVFGPRDVPKNSVEKLTIKFGENYRGEGKYKYIIYISGVPKYKDKYLILDYISQGFPNLKRLELIGDWNVTEEEILEFKEKLKYKDEENNTIEVVIKS